jgi:hypothetical protein
MAARHGGSSAKIKNDVMKAYQRGDEKRNNLAASAASLAASAVIMAAIGVSYCRGGVKHQA